MTRQLLSNATTCDTPLDVTANIAGTAFGAPDICCMQQRTPSVKCSLVLTAACHGWIANAKTTVMQTMLGCYGLGQIVKSFRNMS